MTIIMGAGNLAELAAKIQAPQQVVAAIQYASQRTGVDFGYLLDKAKTESSFNPDAKAKTSSATGLFQFIDRTWLQMVRDHGAEYGLDKYACAIDENCKVDDPKLKAEILNLRKDPAISASMAAEYTKANKETLEANVDGKIGKTELYLAHFLGAGGASKFISAYQDTPNASAASVMPTEASANPGVFYKDGRALTLRQVYNRLAHKFDDKISVADTAPAQTLPASPALAHLALSNDALKMSTAIQKNTIAQIANINIPAMSMPVPATTDVAAALTATSVNPIRQQITQQQLAYLTQVALQTMHESSPFKVMDKDKNQSTL